MLQGEVLVVEGFETVNRRRPRAVAVEEIAALAHEVLDLETTATKVSHTTCIKGCSSELRIW